MITSALPAEGKSLTAVNLALTLSSSYRRRVLLVDGDLRKPSLHELFAVSNTRGFRDGLDNDRESELPIFQISPLLWLLPAGLPVPETVAFTNSGRVQRFLRAAGIVPSG